MHHLPSRKNRNDTTAAPMDIPIWYTILKGFVSSPGTKKAPKIPTADQRAKMKERTAPAMYLAEVKWDRRILQHSV